MSGRYRAEDQPSDFVRVARRSEVPPGSVICVQVDGHDVALANLDGSFYAVDNNCPHNGGPLSKGWLNSRRGALSCPWHAWNWDLRSGRALDPPVDYRVLTYQVRVEGEDVLVSRRPR
jgi:nitrite reductase (NADH) small subunit/3-phenylpropionate/trans-cinnamate dioxygenase ferredoxin subunit